MTKNEFLVSLQNELQKRHIPDWEDVVSEYEQHFALKQADGFSEEEIAAKLGAPAELAAQFEAADEGGKTSSGPAAHLIRFGVGAMDVVAALGMVVLAAWLVVMAAFTAVCAVAGICLIFGWNIAGLLPSMPRLCAVLAGLMLLALCGLSAVGTVYYAAFLCQLCRAYGRQRSNALAAARNRAGLPALPLHPQLKKECRLRLRSASVVLVILFVLFLAACVIASAVSAGSLEFWHVWGWFGYGA